LKGQTRATLSVVCRVAVQLAGSGADRTHVQGGDLPAAFAKGMDRRPVFRV